MTPELQNNWMEIVEQSALTIPAAAEEYGFNTGQFRRYLTCKSVPREKNFVRLTRQWRR